MKPHTHQTLRAWSPLSRNAGEGLSDRAPSALQPLSCIAGEGAERSEAGEGYGEGREEA